MSNPSFHELKCPHPDCDATMHVRNHLAAGEYDCICGGCVVKLSWATYQQGGRKPYLTLAQPRTAQEAHE